MGWDKRQFKSFAKDIKDAYPGKAWSLLVDEMREAVLCERVLRIVLGQDKEAVKVEDIQALYQGIRLEMGQLALWIDDQHKDESMQVHAERKEKRQSKEPKTPAEEKIKEWICSRCVRRLNISSGVGRRARFANEFCPLCKDPGSGMVLCELDRSQIEA